MTTGPSICGSLPHPLVTRRPLHEVRATVAQLLTLGFEERSKLLRPWHLAELRRVDGTCVTVAHGGDADVLFIASRPWAAIIDEVRP